MTPAYLVTAAASPQRGAGGGQTHRAGPGSPQKHHPLTPPPRSLGGWSLLGTKSSLPNCRGRSAQRRMLYCQHTGGVFPLATTGASAKTNREAKGHASHTEGPSLQKVPDRHQCVFQSCGLPAAFASRLQIKCCRMQNPLKRSTAPFLTGLQSAGMFCPPWAASHSAASPGWGRRAGTLCCPADSLHRNAKE